MKEKKITKPLDVLGVNQEIGCSKQNEIKNTIGPIILTTIVSKEGQETPLKKLEKERKTAAITELDRLGMRTYENVEMINAIQFLDDKILIRNMPWAYENMVGGIGAYQEETGKRYYDFDERKTEAKNQGITLPEKKDFEDTFKALPGDAHKAGNILAIILGEGMSRTCTPNGLLRDQNKYGCLGSVSAYDQTFGWDFYFTEGDGEINLNTKITKVVCRPLIKNA